MHASLLEGGMGSVVNRLHSEGCCRGYVVVAVIDEEDVFGCGMERFSGLEEDLWLGLCHEQGVGPCAVVEGREPGQAADDAFRDCIANIGKNAGADPGVLQASGPIDHRLIEAGPHIDVGCEQGLNLRVI